MNVVRLESLDPVHALVRRRDDAIERLRLAAVGDRWWASVEGSNSDGETLLASLAGEHFVVADGRLVRRGGTVPGGAAPAFDWRSAGDVLRRRVPRPVVGGPATLPPVDLAWVRDHRERDCAAIECALADLSRWVEASPRKRWRGLVWVTDPSRSRSLIRIDRSSAASPPVALPPIAARYRVVDSKVIWPAGWRWTPAMPPRDLHAWCGGTKDDWIVADPDGITSVPDSAWQPLDRASIRLTLVAPSGEGSPSSSRSG